jgi:hypothetical protein
MLAALDAWVTTTYPDTVVSEPESIDKEGWLNYSVPGGGGGGAVTFAGARFRRDKPMGMAVVLATKPERDPEEWVHTDVGKMRPIGFAFGLPRPFRKDMTAEEWQYVYDLVAQARKATIEQT